MARDEAPTAISDAWCRRLQVCEPNAVQAAYGDVESCRLLQRIGFRNLDAAALARDCTYDAQVVTDCVQRIRALPCGGFEPEQEWVACTEAYACDDGGDPLVPENTVTLSP